MSEFMRFNTEKMNNIQRQGKDGEVKAIALDLMVKTAKYKYCYNFAWMGIPIIQYPQDIIAMQEIIWAIKPDLIIETGVARGGSLVFYASMLELIGDGDVLGIDIEIKSHNKEKIKAHQMHKRIQVIEGSSSSQQVIALVEESCKNKNRVMVCLDSSHTKEHVQDELRLYSRFVTKGSYLIVFDTIIEDAPDDLYKDRPWGKGNNPKVAVFDFLKTNDNFIADTAIDDKLLITSAPYGFLKRVK